MRKIQKCPPKIGQTSAGSFCQASEFFNRYEFKLERIELLSHSVSDSHFSYSLIDK